MACPIEDTGNSGAVRANGSWSTSDFDMFRYDREVLQFVKAVDDIDSAEKQENYLTIADEE
jgi:hypothetical protein